MTHTEPLADYMARILACTAVEEVWKLHVERMKGYGFEMQLYGATRVRTHGLLGDLSDALILYEGPQAYVDTYIGEELYLESPTNDWASKNTGSASWLEIAQLYASQPISAKRLRIMELNAGLKLIAGYVVSLRDTNQRGAGAIGMSSPGLMPDTAAAIWDASGEEIETLCNLMHLKISGLPQTGLRRPLTTRQRETLQLYAEGKTSRDIATIMDVSSTTVEKHLRGVREALDVETSAHAVRKASVLNLLF